MVVIGRRGSVQQETWLAYYPFPRKRQKRIISRLSCAVPVKLIVTSSEDNASMNIRARLLEKQDWDEKGLFAGHPVLFKDDFTMVQANKIHLDEDYVDDRVSHALGISPEGVIFASRHRAESRIPTLTVHPIGNYSSADFGGKPGTLNPSSPHLM